LGYYRGRDPRGDTPRVGREGVGGVYTGEGVKKNPYVIIGG